MDGPIDPAERRLAERRLLEGLRRLHRREPLRVDVRVDRLVAEVRAAEPTRPTSHRGRRPLTLGDAELRAVLDGLVASGAVERSGHRVRPAEPARSLDPVMRERIDHLVAALREGGVAPPPAEAVAARLGIPAALVEQLRASGELVAVAPRIDYPRETWADLTARLDGLAADATPSVRLVRDELGATRRHAEAIIRGWAAERDRRGVE